MESCRIIDSDGHVMEDAAGISRFLPAPYRAAGPFGWFDLIPPIDHLHVLRGQMPPGAFRQDVGPADWLTFLDEADIEATVLYPSKFLAYGRLPDRDAALAITRAYNDWLHDTYLRASSRFQGMGLIPMQEPAVAAAELRRVVQELGMRGAMLPATGLANNLGAKDYWPVYAEADRLGCAIAVHGGCHGGLGMDNLNVFPAVHAFGHPFAVSIGFGAIVANGLLDRFPNVRFGFLEGGVAWLLLALERLSGSWKAFRPYNPRGELLALRDGESVGDYLLRQIEDGRLFVGCEGDESALPYAVRVAGREAFLYSSDFPHEVNMDTCKAEIREIREAAELSRADVEAIFHGNAERFYGLAASRPPVASEPAASAARAG